MLCCQLLVRTKYKRLLSLDDTYWVVTGMTWTTKACFMLPMHFSTRSLPLRRMGDTVKEQESARMKLKNIAHSCWGSSVR